LLGCLRIKAFLMKIKKFAGGKVESHRSALEKNIKDLRLKALSRPEFLRAAFRDGL
jgi:hypothetical protein